MKNNIIQIKAPKNKIGKKTLEEFISYMKEKCGIKDSLRVEDSIEGAIQMHKVVLPHNMGDTCQNAWNYFIQEAEKKIKEKYDIESLLLKENEHGILYWDIPSNTIDMYFIYKIHLKVIADFLHSEETEKIMKHFAPSGDGCY
ncbi:hypothetical protein XF24_00535 [candidate division SR1 bacterium Aalborg_AAW-1]|nr:hypothetical protein XF24_00535 [candidate division SR1 bacterium Aalborg_AAW-1]